MRPGFRPCGRPLELFAPAWPGQGFRNPNRSMPTKEAGALLALPLPSLIMEAGWELVSP